MLRKAVLILVLFTYYPALSLAEERPYPTNPVERPLTLPEGIWELGGGIGYIRWEERESTLSPILSLRYGINDNLELYLAGLRYRLLKSDAPVMFVVKGRVAGFGHSSDRGTLLLSEVGLDAKQRLDSRFAILYRLEDYYGYYSDSEDTMDLRISLGGVLSFSERFALEVVGTYRKLSGFDTKDAKVLYTALYYNILSNLDILFEASFSDFSENEDLRYLTNSFRQEYGIRFNLRL